MENEKNFDPAVTDDNATQNTSIGNVQSDDGNNNISHSTPPLAISYNLDVLTDDERDIFNDAKDMSDGELSALPNYLRSEIQAVRAKAAVKPAAEVPAEDTPQTETAETEPAEATATETTTTTEADSENKMDKDDIIRMLTEENRKLTARYSTLQGKYNAEVKHSKSPTRKEATPDNGDTSEELFSETTDSDKTSLGSPATDDNEVQQFAEKYGVDLDVAKALVGIVAAKTKDLQDQLSEERTHRLDAKFDRALRKHCGGLGLEEIGTHPLFARYADELFSLSGNSAAKDIADAKANFDLDRAAVIVSKVVSAMQRDNVWNIAGYSKAEPANLRNTTAMQTDTSNAGNNAVRNQAVKPSVVPHSSGNAVNTMQTARSEKDIMEEYKQLEALLRKGNYKAAARMEQLRKEYTKLSAS